MQIFEEFLTMAGGLLLSLALGLLLEELIFGGLVRLFFASQRNTSSSDQKREKKDGGKPCLQ